MAIILTYVGPTTIVGNQLYVGFSIGPDPTDQNTFSGQIVPRRRALKRTSTSRVRRRR